MGDNSNNETKHCEICSLTVLNLHNTTKQRGVRGNVQIQGINTLFIGYFKQGSNIMNKFIAYPRSILLLSTASLTVTAMEESKTIQTKVEQVQQTLVDINSADATQLSTLKGIGAKRAQAIIDYRSQYGKFTSLEQIVEVKGVGKNFLVANKGAIKI